MTRMTLVPVLALSILLAACGGGSSGSTQVESPPTATNPTPPADTRPWYNRDAPDYSDNPDRPEISLTGDDTIILAFGEEFNDPGATAFDAQDGDISGSIEVTNRVLISQPGDYFVRYSVTDSDQNEALDKIRIVRIIEQDTVDYSFRPLGDFQINWGYIEYLPPSYGMDPDATYPLLVYHHGNAANANNLDTDDPIRALNDVLTNFGPPALMRFGRWNKELPFIVLAPQAAVIRGTSISQRIDEFLSHALNTYKVDTSRIYMMGWSQGGFITLEYAMQFPNKLAAAVPISAGAPFDGEPPDNFCN